MYQYKLDSDEKYLKDSIKFGKRFKKAYKVVKKYRAFNYYCICFLYRSDKKAFN